MMRGRPKRRKLVVKRRQLINRFNYEYALLGGQQDGVVVDALPVSPRDIEPGGQDNSANEDADDERDDDEDTQLSLHIDEASSSSRASSRSRASSNPMVFNEVSPSSMDFDVSPSRTDEDHSGISLPEFELDSDFDAPPLSTDESEQSCGEDIELEDWDDLNAFLNGRSDVDQDVELKTFLADWITKENISGAAADRLLKGLKALPHQGPTFACLPNSARSLLKTPRKVTVIPMAVGGVYYHFGLERGIQHQLGLRQLSKIPSVVRGRVNTDGLPLSKSSRSHFHPILFLLEGEQTPFPVGIYHGSQKPASANEFLKMFVEDARLLQTNGIIHRGLVLEFKIMNFNLDAVDRSFICGIVGHTGYYSCPKCITDGHYYRKPGRRKGRVTNPDMEAALRTHQTFIDREHPEHHVRRTILEDLTIDMVRDFPIDYMHLVCLGVMRKLLKAWVKRATSMHLISQENVAEISRRLLAIRNSVPGEFVRQPRSLIDLPRWKASEYRQFLLYWGPVILKDVLPAPLYNHFLCLHLAMKILVTERLCYRYNDYSKLLLRHFVSESRKLYGPEFVVYNVHGLIHLPDDVMRFGPLDNFSCFPFENFLQQIKRKVRRSQNPLVQVVKRIAESLSCKQLQIPVNNPPLSLSNPHRRGPLPINGEFIFRCQQFKTAVFDSWRLSTRTPNNYVFLDDGSIVFIQNFVQYGNNVQIVGYRFLEPVSLLDPPFDANGIIFSQRVNNSIISPLISFPIESVTCKAYAIPMPWYLDDYDEETEETSFFAVFPLLMEDKYR